MSGEFEKWWERQSFQFKDNMGREDAGTIWNAAICTAVEVCEKEQQDSDDPAEACGAGGCRRAVNRLKVK